MIHKPLQGRKYISVEIRIGEAMSNLKKSSLKEIKSHIKQEKQPKVFLYLVAHEKGKRRKGHTVSG